MGSERNRGKSRRSQGEVPSGRRYPTTTHINKTPSLLVLRRVVLKPMSGNIDTVTDPCLFNRFDIVKESTKSPSTSRSTNHTTMKSNRHHLGLSIIFCFFMELVKGIFQIGKELVTAVETLRGNEPHVVVIQCVGNNEMGFFIVIYVIREIISIAIIIIEKTSFFHNKTSCVGVRLTLIDTKRSFSEKFLVNFNRLPDVFSLSLFIDILIVDPSIPVGSNLKTSFFHSNSCLGVLFQGLSNSEDGGGEVSLREQFVKTPISSTRAVLVEGFHVHVALTFVRRTADDVREKPFRSFISEHDVVLTAFLWGWWSEVSVVWRVEGGRV